MQKLYTNKLINFQHEPLFFGTGKNSQRFDQVKYPTLEKLLDRMSAIDWAFDEIACTKDQADFNVLSDAMKHAYTRVLNKLIFLDSIQGRGLLQTIGSVVTDPMLELVLLEWQRFEGVKHSRSYTHILRSVYPDPSKIFDESFEIPELLKLADSISAPYEKCFELVTKYNLNEASKEEVKEAILWMLIEINILEGVRFYSGFATIWSMHYSQGLMERTGKILQLICKDENLHLAITQNLLKILSSNKDEGFTEIYEKIKPKIREKYLEAAEQEFKWIDYLFIKGAFLGMTPDLAKSYLKYIVNRRLKSIGEDVIFDGFGQNPIPWVSNYISSDRVEGLPQEQELVSYVMSIMDNSISDNQITNLKRKLKIPGK